jgi:hypothetical protein
MMITVMKDDNNDDAIILKINDINDGNYVDVYDEDCDDANYDDADYDDVVRCHSAAYRECSSYEHYGPTVVAELSEWIVGELNGSNSYLIEEVFYHHHDFVLISILVEVKRTATYNVIYSTAERSCVVMMMV